MKIESRAAIDVIYLCVSMKRIACLLSGFNQAGKGSGVKLKCTCTLGGLGGDVTVIGVYVNEY